VESCPVFRFTTAPDDSMVAVPSGPSPADGAGDVEIAPRLSWDETAGAFAYSVFLWPDGDQRPAHPLAVGLATPTIDLTAGLDEGAAYRWVVVAHGAFAELDAAGPEWTFSTAGGTPGVRFRRGDANADGTSDLSDAIFTLSWLFLGAATPSCLDAADANDDGGIDIADPTFLLNHLFLGGARPPAPSASCGLDPTDDMKGCSEHAPCGPRVGG
jgi:hypothetical protein